MDEVEFPDGTPEEQARFQERAKGILDWVQERQEVVETLFGEPTPDLIARLDGEMALAKLGVARFIDELPLDGEEDPRAFALAAIGQFVLTSRYWDGGAGNTMTQHLYSALLLLAERRHGAKVTGFDVDKLEREMHG